MGPCDAALLTRMLVAMELILAYTYHHKQRPSKLSAVAFKTAVSNFNLNIVLWSIRIRLAALGIQDAGGALFQ